MDHLPRQWAWPLFYCIFGTTVSQPVVSYAALKISAFVELLNRWGRSALQSNLGSSLTLLLLLSLLQAWPELVLWARVDMGRMGSGAGAGLGNAALTCTVLFQSLSLCAGQESSAFSSIYSTSSPLCCRWNWWVVEHKKQQVERCNSSLPGEVSPCQWLICPSGHSPQLYVLCRASTDASSNLFSFSSFLGRVFLGLPAPSLKTAMWVERFYTRVHT